jgi:hypothetical protein
MVKSFEDPPIREDLLYQMRLFAQRGTTVRELVRFVQQSLGYDETMYVPVFSYLAKAFGLHLREILPIREWIGSDDDAEIDAEIMPAIERNRQYWMPLISREVAVAK